MTFAEDRLAELLRAKGIEPSHANQAAKLAVDFFREINLVSVERLHAYERDAHVFSLVMSYGLTASEVQERLGVCRATVFLALKRQAAARAALMKLVA